MSGLGSSIYCTLPQDMNQLLLPDPSSLPVATRLACTIGPASQDEKVLTEMLKAGMSIARIDFTYGNMDFHLKSLQNLKKAMVNANKLCAIMLQPHGPEIKVLNRPQGQSIQLTQGQSVVLTSDQTQPASSKVLPLNWNSSFMGCGLHPGSQVFVGQYLFTGAETTSAYLTVAQVEDKSLICTVNNSCCLGGPSLIVKLAAGARNPSPSFTEQDVQQLAAWSAANPTGAADFIALPRTRNAADVLSCKGFLERLGYGGSKVIAKLEDLEGLVNHGEILDAADAVIFSRGSLGTCMEVEKVFLAQKMLLRAANAVGKPCFVTRVVDSITDAPRPTRAEATDVANLVLDGADGVLLGSETFRGQYPVDTVQVVAAICRAAERVFDNHAFYRSLMDSQGYYTLAPQMERAEALASAAVRAAHKVDAKLIIAFTVTGRTARLLAKYKPGQPILTAVCTDPKSALFSNKPRSSLDRIASNKNVAAMDQANSPALLMQPNMLKGALGSQTQNCLLYRGAAPVLVNASSGSAIEGDVLDAVLDYAKSRNLVQPGDRVVVSQCPRDINSPVMRETGVVQLLTVDQPADSTSGQLPVDVDVVNEVVRKTSFY